MKIEEDSDFQGYAVIDVETTGLSALADIVELGLVLLTPQGNIETTVGTLVQPLGVMRESRIHGITADMVEGAPTISLIIPGLLSMLDGRVLVAHNSRLEIQVLNKELIKNGVPLSHFNFIDTLEIAKKNITGIKNYKLATLAQYYGVEVESPHQALSDALATTYVFQKMREEFPQEMEAVPLFLSDVSHYKGLDPMLLLPR